MKSINLRSEDLKGTEPSLKSSFFSKLGRIPFGALAKGGILLASAGNDPKLWRIPFNVVKTFVSIIFNITVTIYTLIFKIIGFKDYAEPSAKLASYVMIAVLILAAVSSLSAATHLHIADIFLGL